MPQLGWLGLLLGYLSNLGLGMGKDWFGPRLIEAWSARCFGLNGIANIVEEEASLVSTGAENITRKEMTLLSAILFFGNFSSFCFGLNFFLKRWVCSMLGDY